MPSSCIADVSHYLHSFYQELGLFARHRCAGALDVRESVIQILNVLQHELSDSGCDFDISVSRLGTLHSYVIHEWLYDLVLGCKNKHYNPHELCHRIRGSLRQRCHPYQSYRRHESYKVSVLNVQCDLVVA